MKPAELELWKKFIDPGDWEKALAVFREEPWKYYSLPGPMQYPDESWPNFKKACQWVSELAKEAARQPNHCLTLQNLLEINALVTTGDPRHWKSSLRNNRPIFNCQRRMDLTRVFDGGTTAYRNPDQLPIRVDGFRPVNALSLDFFIACQNLSKASDGKFQSAYQDFLRFLEPRVTEAHDTWQIYFLTRTEDITHQLERILDWYEKSARTLQEMSATDPRRARLVWELAAKMQRYVDITQFCMDGSGRTSKLVQDYILLRFGMSPLYPSRFTAHGRDWPNGTYLTFDEVLLLSKRGRPNGLLEE